MFERISRRSRRAGTPAPALSFGSWDSLGSDEVIQVCHPYWRGVRTVTYSFGTPVVESADLMADAASIAGPLVASGPACVVIQGWPPGAEVFARRLSGSGVRVKAVLHSSPTQHGAEASEARVVETILGLAAERVLDGVGMSKAGVHEAFASLGHPVSLVPNRAPRLPEIEKSDLGPGGHVGVFAEPFWRKNVTTQVMAAKLLNDPTVHLLAAPDVGYLRSARLVEYGEMPYEAFLGLQASVDLNLYVTLSECYPSTPQESYLTGVPCLMSRTSAVFRNDVELWELTTVDELDNPASIAAAARRLLENRQEVVDRANAWIEAADTDAAAIWERFVSS